MNAHVLDETIARRVLWVVDQGLVNGMGVPEPGKLCVEAAVCYAYGLPHSDQPPCVAPAVRSLKIRLNDARWSSDAARAKGLRRLAIAQLGSAGVLDEREFAKRCATLAIQTCVPNALRAAASVQKNPDHRAKLLAAAEKCEREPTRASAQEARAYAADADAYYAADAAAAAAYAADAAKRDEALANYCEGVVQILIEMKAPGCEYLWLTGAA